METVLGTPTVTVLPSTGRVGEKVVVVTGQVLSGGTEMFKHGFLCVKFETLIHLSRMDKARLKSVSSATEIS